MKSKAFSYLRVSGKGQIDGDGFTRQAETISRYVNGNQIKIMREFRDNGVSGVTDAFDREGLTDLFVAIKANGVRLVIVENATRIARDLMVGEIILAEFRKVGVKVISADGGVDLTVGEDNPTGQLVRQILGAISTWEKCLIVQKLRASRLRMRRAGKRCEGRKPYGVDQREKEVIERICQMRRTGLSFTRIAKALNTDGIVPRKAIRAGQSAQWHPPMIQRIVDRAVSMIKDDPMLPN
jgi:DNA invertase Pin-like site-specific DNA recombinase